MTFVEAIPKNLEWLQSKRAIALEFQRRMRRDALEDLGTHDMCCADCPHKDSDAEAFDDAQVALEESEEWMEYTATIDALTIEIKRLKAYQKWVS